MGARVRFQCLSEEIAAAPVPMEITPQQRILSACVGVLAVGVVVTPMGESISIFYFCNIFVSENDVLLLILRVHYTSTVLLALTVNSKVVLHTILNIQYSSTTF